MHWIELTLNRIDWPSVVITTMNEKLLIYISDYQLPKTRLAMDFA
jgi:hypothetical protein